MNKHILPLALLAGALLSGCGTTRFVTNETWLGRDEFFISTSEVNTTLFFFKSWQAKVISCKHQQDHSLVCADQADLNQYLNADNTQK